MDTIGVSEKEDRFFESVDFVLDLVRLEVRLELGEIIDGTLAVGGCNNVLGILPDISSDPVPSGLHSGDGVCKSTVLCGALDRAM